ncbi:hypothetical protein EVAR_66843_1 [Eumeta japonica]|uniref:Uncharacterized protein n=1 Tax=Eumeta variegata TaxID=151549 RepID=A0A4C1ZD56_EUMVA|nr:hypothetical protein EVAR_66843_1 [Eumeta japonica]
MAIQILRVFVYIRQDRDSDRDRHTRERSPCNTRLQAQNAMHEICMERRVAPAHFLYEGNARRRFPSSRHTSAPYRRPNRKTTDIGPQSDNVGNQINEEFNENK